MSVVKIMFSQIDLVIAVVNGPGYIVVVSIWLWSYIALAGLRAILVVEELCSGSAPTYM